MEELSWATTRAKYTALFNAPPQPLDDNDISTVFRKHPLDIIAELERIAKAYAAGKLHSPWRALAAKLDRIVGDHDHVDINSELRIRQAEAWILNAGMFAPTEAEVIDELFHSTSALLAGLEAQLGERMLALWRENRPRGEQTERDFEQRGEEHRISRGLPTLEEYARRRGSSTAIDQPAT